MQTGKSARFYGFAFAALVLGPTIVGILPADAKVVPHVIPIDSASIDDPAALRNIYAAPPPSLVADPTASARCGDPAPDPVPDGAPIVVTMSPAASFTVGRIAAKSWRNPPVNDPTWRMHYQGLMWIKPLARRAAMDHQRKSLAALVAQVAAFHRQNPDSHDNNYGWDEGTALRRLETENCLYALTHSAALTGSMTADAAVLLGSRYYGPPAHAVHNHGLMANLQLVRSADLINRTAWKTTAIKRMTTEAPLAFSKLGISYEQSSGYQGDNANLWQQAALVLKASPGSAAAAAKIRTTVTKAYHMYAWMTEPDGHLVQIGDADEVTGRPMDLRGNRAVRDDQAGWIIGRWSWTDPNTPYYTIRYGPARRAHGHNDRAGGVTWSIKGVRVLVGPGRYNYDTAGIHNRYQISPQGQNVAVPDKSVAGDGASKVSSSTFRTASHVVVVKDTVYGRAHTRGITVNRDLPRFVVTDSFAGTKAWQQWWHLDPAWTLVSGAVGGTKMVFQHPSGHRLTITTTGRFSSLLRGRSAPPGYGWHFPSFQVREAAYQIAVTNHGKKCTTTFRVS